MTPGPPSSFRSLVFAVVSGAPEAPRQLQAVCEGLQRATSRLLIPQVLRTYADLVRHMRGGTAHIAWAPPLIALEIERAGAGSTLLCCARKGRTLYHSALFSRRGSPIQNIADLTGTRVAWVDRDSLAGYVIPRLRISAAGLDPSRTFARESFLGTHAAVARAVISAAADAGATYVTLDPRTGKPSSAGWQEAGAADEAVTIIATAGPIPSDGIVFSSRLPLELSAQLASGLMALPAVAADAVRTLLRADSFERPTASHFDEIRKLIGAPRKTTPPGRGP